MGLEEVKTDILQNAKKEAESEISKALEETDKILEEAKQKVKEIQDAFKEDVKSLKNTLVIKETASSNLEGKRHLLDVKKEILDEVFSETNERIRKLGRKDKEDAMKKLQKKASDEIEIGAIYCNPKDKAFVEFDKVIEHECLGGIIAVDKSGNVKIDYTFDTILVDIFDRYVGEVSNILFHEK